MCGASGERCVRSFTQQNEATTLILLLVAEREGWAARDGGVGRVSEAGETDNSERPTAMEQQDLQDSVPTASHATCQALVLTGCSCVGYSFRAIPQ